MSAFAAKLALKPHEFPSLSTLRKSVGRRDPLHAILKCWFPGMIFGRSPIPDLLHLTSVFACGQRNCDQFFCPFVPPGISQRLRKRAATLVVAPENRNQVLTAK